MHCRHCTTGERETQENLEKCTFVRKYRESLDLTIREHKLIFWRRITRILKDLKNANKDMFNKSFGVIEPENLINGTTWSEAYPNGQVHASAVSDWETCTRGREGPRTYAQDMSVGEMISDHPP